MKFPCIIAIAAIFVVSTRAVSGGSLGGNVHGEGAERSKSSKSSKQRSKSGKESSKSGKQSSKSGELPRICKGSVLECGEKLYPNEYICATEGDELYRFGLDGEGLLAEIHGKTDGTAESVYWSPGKRGSYVSIQCDGNLVLRDEDENVVWSSSCYGAGAVLTFDSTYPGVGARTMVPDSEVSIWSVRSWADDGICNPPIYCKGHVLGPGESLERDEYLCAADGWKWHGSYRFGVGNVGKLALFRRDEVIWTPDEETSGSSLLRLKRSGNLVHRNQNNDVVWASGCKSPGNKVKMTSNGIFMTNKHGDTSWYVSYDGEESDCFPTIIPPDLCTQVSPNGQGDCRVRMIDNLNIIDTVLRVEDLGDNKYAVTDNFDGEKPWTVNVEKAETGALFMDAGVPEVTCKEMMDGWQMQNDTQLEFRVDPDHHCTDYGKNLIYFMIMEWFYFG